MAERPRVIHNDVAGSCGRLERLMSGLSDQRTVAVSDHAAPRRRIALLFVACAS
jgi:hypothetical protein